MRLGGIAALVLGVVFAVTGIIDAIHAATAIREDAVVTGQVGRELAFESEPAEKLTVYIEVFSINETTKDSKASATSCVVRGDGFQDSFSGSRQGVSTTVNEFVSVGSFTPSGGSGRILCQGTEAPMLVTPRGGGQVFVAVLKIIGGVILAGLGGTVAIVGLLRRRRARPAEPPLAGLPR